MKSKFGKFKKVPPISWARYFLVRGIRGDRKIHREYAKYVSIENAKRYKELKASSAPNAKLETMKLVVNRTLDFMWTRYDDNVVRLISEKIIEMRNRVELRIAHKKLIENDPEQQHLKSQLVELCGGRDQYELFEEGYNIIMTEFERKARQLKVN